MKKIEYQGMTPTQILQIVNKMNEIIDFIGQPDSPEEDFVDLNPVTVKKEVFKIVPEKCCDSPRKFVSNSTRFGRRVICNNCGKPWIGPKTTHEKECPSARLSIEEYFGGISEVFRKLSEPKVSHEEDFVESVISEFKKCTYPALKKEMEKEILKLSSEIGEIAQGGVCNNGCHNAGKFIQGQAILAAIRDTK